MNYEVYGEFRDHYIELVLPTSQLMGHHKGRPAARLREEMLRAIYRRAFNAAASCHPKVRVYVMRLGRRELESIWEQTPKWIRRWPLMYWIAAHSLGTRHGLESRDREDDVVKAARRRSPTV